MKKSSKKLSLRPTLSFMVNRSYESDKSTKIISIYIYSLKNSNPRLQIILNLSYVRKSHHVTKFVFQCSEMLSSTFYVKSFYKI